MNGFNVRWELYPLATRDAMPLERLHDYGQQLMRTLRALQPHHPQVGDPAVDVSDDTGMLGIELHVKAANTIEATTLLFAVAGAALHRIGVNTPSWPIEGPIAAMFQEGPLELVPAAPWPPSRHT